jgi:transcriptional regulator with XRE-family HTH domain
MNATQRVLRLGAALRTLRLQRGFTLEKLAEASGVSTGLLSQLERGIGNPSLYTVLKIADALNVPVGNFFPSSDSDSAIIVRKKERQVLPSDAPGMSVELLSPDPRHPIQFLWIEREPGESTEQRPSMHKGAEFGVVIEGTLEVHLGDEIYVLEQGDSINFQSNVSHWYRNPGTERVVYVCAVASPTPVGLESLP